MPTLVELLKTKGSNPAVKSLVVLDALPGAWERRPLTLDALPTLETLRVHRHGSRHGRVLASLSEQFPGIQIL